MARGPKAIFDSIKERYGVASTPERAGWVASALVLSPALVPVLLGYTVARKFRSECVELRTTANGRLTDKSQRPFFATRVKVPRIPVDREAEAALRAKADTFALVRVIGNDLPPRHAIGQSRANLEFMLRTEPDLPDCEKRWIVNRIVDPAEEAAVIALLEAHGQTYRRIPFLMEDYAQTPLDMSTFPFPQYLLSDDYHTRTEVEQVRASTQAYRLRNAYAMHNNGGRNAAIEFGVESGAKWVLPFDGNCLLTQEDWVRLRADIATAPRGTRYAVVPMARLGSNDSALDPIVPSEAIEEPQIAFRCDAPLRFDEAFPYGRRPKVELLTRLDVRGPWDRWWQDPWDVNAGPTDPDSHRVGRAGLTRRLASGRDDLETEGRASLHGRRDARNLGIVTVLRDLDVKVMTARGYDPAKPAFYRHLPASDPARETLRKAADAALGRKPGSVVQKTEVGPSGNPHDYFHPAPYWWPDPETEHGLPYIWRDGERLPGTVMYEADSDRYDRTRLQRMFDDTLACGLAWAAFGETRYRDHASLLVETWFLNPDTAMTPHLRFAQVRRGHDGDQGNRTGVLEMKDIAYLLDVVRLLDDGDLSARLSDWLRRYLDWLLTSAQGESEARAENSHGSYYDLQVAAIAAFLGDTDTLMDRYVASVARLGGHFADDGSQPHELVRSQTRHYTAFNLHGWQAIAVLYRSCGMPLEHQPEWSRLADAARWILERRTGDWPSDQVGPFDFDRWAPIALMAEDLVPVTCDAGRAPPAPTMSDCNLAWAKPMFHPHDGVPPFWPVILPPTAVATGGK